MLDRAKGVVTISEDFTLEKPVDVMLSLMTCVAPVIQPGGVKVGGTLLAFDAAALKPEIEKIALTDTGLKRAWGDAVYRIKLNSAAPVAMAQWKLELRGAS
jgi:hypothetical protein